MGGKLLHPDTNTSIGHLRGWCLRSKLAAGSPAPLLPQPGVRWTPGWKGGREFVQTVHFCLAFSKEARQGWWFSEK